MKKIRIGIDITDLNPEFYGGLDTYCLNLIKSFGDLRNNFQLIIFLNQKYYQKRKKNLVLKRNVKYLIYKPTFFRQLIIKIYNRIFINCSNLFLKKKYFIDFVIKNFSQYEFKKLVEKNSDLLICPSVLLKHYNLSIPTITNLHDIQHEYYPEFFTKTELLRRDVQYTNTAKYTSKMIASGLSMKKDFVKKYPFLKKKISIIHEGINIKMFQERMKDSVTKKFFNKKKIFKQKFFFLPAQLWKHKNHITVIKGFEKFNITNKNNIKLVFCGHRYPETEYIFDYIKKKSLTNVIYLNVINYKKLIWCMQNCISVICPALYESSSLVNLEAIASKTTIISSNIPTNLEKAKFFKINTFKKLNPVDLSKVFYKISHSNSHRIKQINFNNLSIKQFSWKKTASKYYEEAINLINIDDKK